MRSGSSGLSSRVWYIRAMTKRLRKSAVARQHRPSLTVAFDREEDGRWIAEVPRLPGVLAYGKTKQEALRHVYAVALRTLADNVEGGSSLAPMSRLFGNAVARS